MSKQEELEALNHLTSQSSDWYQNDKAEFVAKLWVVSAIVISVSSYVLFRFEYISVPLGAFIMSVASLFAGVNIYYLTSLRTIKYIVKHIDSESVKQRINELKT